MAVAASDGRAPKRLRGDDDADGNRPAARRWRGGDPRLGASFDAAGAERVEYLDGRARTGEAGGGRDLLHHRAAPGMGGESRRVSM